MRRILYYPNINIEDGVWLRNALLYWDQVSSIMPVDETQYDLSPEIQYLMTTEFFKATRPEEIILSESYDDFLDEARTKIIDYNPNSSSGRRARMHSSKLEVDIKNKIINNSKLSTDIIDLLNEKEYIERSCDRNWYNIEQEISDIYMTVLAKYLADINDNVTVIGTDKSMFQNYAYSKDYSGNESNTRRNFMQYICKMLPTPYMNVSIVDLLEFKVKRKRLIHTKPSGSRLHKRDRDNHEHQTFQEEPQNIGDNLKCNEGRTVHNRSRQEHNHAKS